eukprot:3266514-Alexandrium_andersonii.AAC.1
MPLSSRVCAPRPRPRNHPRHPRALDREPSEAPREINGLGLRPSTHTPNPMGFVGRSSQPV